MSSRDPGKNRAIADTIAKQRAALDTSVKDVQKKPSAAAVMAAKAKTVPTKRKIPPLPGETMAQYNRRVAGLKAAGAATPAAAPAAPAKDTTPRATGANKADDLLKRIEAGEDESTITRRVAAGRRSQK